MPRGESTAIARRDQDAFALIAPLIADLPTIEEDPTPRMMELLINAPTPAAWASVFESRSARQAVGKSFRVLGLRYSESAFEESRTGIFLICDVIDLETGERDVLTVGGDLAMAQLLGLWKQGNLPRDVRVVEKATPTKAGFKPYHLEDLGKPTNGPGVE